MKIDGLIIKEVDLFKAVDCWATRQERWRQRLQAPPPDGKKKREIIGEDILNAIRFPLMSLKEFATDVIDCNILTLEEVSEMVKQYADVATSPFLICPNSKSSCIFPALL